MPAPVPHNPIGAATGALTGAGNALGGGTAQALKEVVSALAEVGKVIKGVTEPTFKALADTLKTVLAPATKLAMTGVKELGEGLKHLARLATGVALGGLATVGEGLEKVATKLEPVTKRLFAFGEIVAITFTNTLERVAEGLKPLTDRVAAIGSAIKDTFAYWLGELGAKIEPMLKPVTSKFGESVKRMFDVEGTLKPVTRGMSDVFKGLAGAFAIATGAAVALGYGIGQFVAKASPAHFEQFTLAVSDLMATIGAGLLPVFNLVIEIVRAAGDTLVTFTRELGGALGTVLRPLVDVLKMIFEMFGHVGQSLTHILESAAPALVSVGEAFKAIIEAVKPLIDFIVDLVGGALSGAFKLLANVLEMILSPITAFIMVVGDLVKFIVDKVRSLLEWIGILDPEKPGTEAGKSRGMAARSASTTSVDSVLQKAREGAFSLGAASATDPATKTATAAESIRARIDEIYRWLKGLPKEIGNAVADALNPFSGGSASTVSESVVGAMSPGAGVAIDAIKKDVADRAAWYSATSDALSWTERAGPGAGTVTGGAP